MKRHFASDNQSGVCPEAWEALARANADGHTPSYGDDPWTQRAAAKVRELFETDCYVYFVFGGTAANALAISTLGRSFSTVICSETAHIKTSECGAVAFYSGGMELITCLAPSGKISPADVERVLSRPKSSHRSEVCALSITQATESGTVYSLAEVAELSKLAKSRGLRVHMDGARFSNAVAHLGCRPADLTWKLGVDVLCFGGTKNGMMMGEAVVIFDRALAAEFDHRCLQGGQMASKSRFVAAQWEAMLESGAWLRHATHANAMATRLEEKLRSVDGVSIANPAQSNAVFARISPEVQKLVRDQGWSFFNWDGPDSVRLMCSWDTTPDDVDQFASAVRNASSARR